MPIPDRSRSIVSSVRMIIRYSWLLYNIYHSTVSCKYPGVLTQRKVIVVYVPYILVLEPGYPYPFVFKCLYHNRQTACLVEGIVVALRLPGRRMELYDISKHITDIHIRNSRTGKLLQT